MEGVNVIVNDLLMLLVIVIVWVTYGLRSRAFCMVSGLTLVTAIFVVVITLEIYVD